jgi:hypothetical protein
MNSTFICCETGLFYRGCLSAPFLEVVCATFYKFPPRHDKETQSPTTTRSSTVSRPRRDPCGPERVGYPRRCVSPVHLSTLLLLALSHAIYRLADLIELRKLRRAKQGIESSKLIVGDAKKRRRRNEEDEFAEQEPGGLRSGARTPDTAVPEDESVFMLHIVE